MDKKSPVPAGANGASKLTDYEIQGKLGQGSFGIVYKIKRKCNHTFLLLKLYSRPEDLRAEADRHEQDEFSDAKGSSARGHYSLKNQQSVHRQILRLVHWEEQHQHHHGVLRERRSGAVLEETDGKVTSRINNLAILLRDVSRFVIPTFEQNFAPRYQND